MNSDQSEITHENKQIYTNEINTSHSQNYITINTIQECFKITNEKELQSESYYGSEFFVKLKGISNEKWIYGLLTNNQI